MSKPVSKTLIGAFVVGALALVFLAVAVFGSGQLFRSTTKFVLFFDSSISGLSIGSPVVLRGVHIGRVTSIRLVGDVEGLKYLIPVYIEIDRERFDTPLGTKEHVDIATYMQQLIAKGLRARLASQSLLTGQLMIEIDFYATEELEPSKRLLHEYGGVLVLPTIPSKLDSLMQRFSTLPLENIAQNLLEITSDIKAFIHSDETMLAMSSFKNLGTDIAATLRKVQSTLNEFENLAREATGLSDSTKQLVRSMNAQIDTLLADIEKTIKEFNGAIGDVRDVINPSSLPVIELSKTLQDLSEAAKAVHSLAETLDHTPDALFRGKRNSK